MNFSNSSIVAFNLIKLCVDTTINTDTSINTKNYVLDLSNISTLNKTGVDSFLAIKNSILPTTIDDSTIIFPTNNLEDSYMKQSMLVKFRVIQVATNDRIIVTVSKIRTRKKTIDAIIELKRHFDGYDIINFKRTN